MVAEPTSKESRWVATGWIPLDYASAVRAPRSFGAVLIGDGREEPLLVTHGVIREELWRILADPLSQAHEATFFRYVETPLAASAETLAREMFDRWSVLRKSRVRWREFAPLDGPSFFEAEPRAASSDAP